MCVFYHILTSSFWHFQNLMPYWTEQRQTSFPWHHPCACTLIDHGQWPIRACVQGCCLTGAQEPEAPAVHPRAAKTSNKEPEWAAKAYDSQANFQWKKQQNSLLILHFETTTENVWSLAIGKKIFLPIKGKHTPLCLELRFCDFRCI